jgi:hypothetical protein
MILVFTGFILAWKVMENEISLSRPGKSWNFSLGHGKSWTIGIKKQTLSI